VPLLRSHSRSSSCVCPLPLAPSHDNVRICQTQWVVGFRAHVDADPCGVHVFVNVGPGEARGPGLGSSEPMGICRSSMRLFVVVK
jgi:hypothetical protein